MRNDAIFCWRWLEQWVGEIAFRQRIYYVHIVRAICWRAGTNQCYGAADQISNLRRTTQTTWSATSANCFQVPPSNSNAAPPATAIGPAAPATASPASPTSSANDEGFYLANYVGQGSAGVATLVLEKNAISGFDTFGGSYDGSYRKEADGSLTISVTVTVPAGVGLATGVPGQGGPQSFPITGRLPPNFANGSPVTIDVQGQPVQVSFSRVRPRSAPLAGS